MCSMQHRLKAGAGVPNQTSTQGDGTPTPFLPVPQPGKCVY